MENMDPGALVTMVTIFVAGFSIAIGTIAPALAEGRAAAAALESMARQPELAGDIRTTLLISMALLESTAIYVLLVVLILIFANPLIGQFF
jgi:F-type H+-transporting ATPase subunit c